MRQLVWLALAITAASAQPLLVFDLRDAATAAQWQPWHNVGPLKPTAEGLELSIRGDDPYIGGPTAELPSDVPLFVTLRAKSSVKGQAQLFWSKNGYNEQDSCSFPLKAGEWCTVRVAVPALGPRVHLRLDPPGSQDGQTCVVESLTFSECHTVAPPENWPLPTAPASTAHAVALASGDLTVRQYGAQLGAYELSVAGQRLARGYNHALIGYIIDGQTRYISLDTAQVAVKHTSKSIELRGSVKDPDGATWTIVQRFAPCPVSKKTGEERGAAIWATAEVTVDQPRDVAYLPLLTVFTGAARDKGLLAGVDYLDEPDTSSSNADFAGQLAWRQVTDTARLTQPLMATSFDDKWIALAWEPREQICAAYDSPDRLYRSGGSTMGLLFPGSDGENRPQNSLMPYDPQPLAANQTLTVRAAYYGGHSGASTTPGHGGIIGAVQTWCALHPLPPLPKVDRAAYLRSASRSWLESDVRRGAQFRHATVGNDDSWKPSPCGDAPYYLAWLAAKVDDPALAERLRQLSADSLAVCAKPDWALAGVSHVRLPLSPLLFDGVAETVAHLRARGADLVKGFGPNGDYHYTAPQGGLDLGSTHFEKTANGFIANPVAAILQAALLTGDAQLKADGLRLLRTLDRYDGSVPRGAQTWECPLHSPDILASAHLVSAYVVGYELTGDPAMLARARYWAWTGVPFIHLAPTWVGEFGPYATCAVMCATHFISPNWCDRPVQWCGLVYADALRRLAVYDDGPWTRLADGIALSGIQQSYPDDEPLRRGLLPDSVGLRSGNRFDPAINPGTLQLDAMYLWGAPYDYRVDRANGVTICCAGEIKSLGRKGGQLTVDFTTWRPGSLVYVAGADAAWSATLDGLPVDTQRGAAWLAVPAPAAGRHTLMVRKGANRPTANT